MKTEWIGSLAPGEQRTIDATGMGCVLGWAVKAHKQNAAHDAEAFTLATPLGLAVCTRAVEVAAVCTKAGGAAVKNTLKNTNATCSRSCDRTRRRSAPSV